MRTIVRCADELRQNETHQTDRNLDYLDRNLLLRLVVPSVCMVPGNAC